MPNPRDHQSLLRLLGMVKYLSAYIPHESIITTPMRALLCKDVTWQWEHEHDRALVQVKGTLASAPVQQFYNVKKAVTLQPDASQRGLSCCQRACSKSAWTLSMPATRGQTNCLSLVRSHQH